MDTFHDEVSPLVDASQSRLVSGKHGEEWITYAYAFRLGWSTLDERTLIVVFSGDGLSWFLNKAPG